MTEKTIKVITCNGPVCMSECRDGIIPVGWVTFTGVTGDRHLCPACANEDNISRQVHYQAMEQLSKERGD